MAQDWTAERARALPDDGNRYEVLDGVLAVTPAPEWRHQDVAFAFARHLDAYLKAHRIGRAVMAPADVEFSSTRLLEPDVFATRFVQGRPPAAFGEVRHLLLALEVLSPSTARRDRITKRHIYMSEAVDEYWIVDTDARTIERWRPGQDRPEIVDGILRWEPAPGVPPLEVDIAATFAEALGES
ncbi:MAG TPA: Uma2 family endonuclease [Gemmatimonadaceae bacterium]|nr:Uma2 family endonuclease [Gemmatimonadaceae bacterium]